MVYKGARLYELEDKDELVQEENLSEHYDKDICFLNNVPERTNERPKGNFDKII